MIHKAALLSDQVIFTHCDCETSVGHQSGNATVLVYGQAAKILGSNINM